MHRMMSDEERSPNLTPCDYFLWGYVKEAVYVPPLPITLDDLRNRITTDSTEYHNSRYSLLRWLGHVEWMDYNRIVKRIVYFKPKGKKRNGRLNLRRENGVLLKLEILDSKIGSKLLDIWCNGEYKGSLWAVTPMSNSHLEYKAFDMSKTQLAAFHDINHLRTEETSIQRSKVALKLLFTCSNTANTKESKIKEEDITKCVFSVVFGFIQDELKSVQERRSLAVINVDPNKAAAIFQRLFGRLESGSMRLYSGTVAGFGRPANTDATAYLSSASPLRRIGHHVSLLSRSAVISSWVLRASQDCPIDPQFRGVVGGWTRGAGIEQPAVFRPETKIGKEKNVLSDLPLATQNIRPGTSRPTYRREKFIYEMDITQSKSGKRWKNNKLTTEIYAKDSFIEFLLKSGLLNIWENRHKAENNAY
ncbi:hypothetical protein C0J52_00484 [Blattella germanica]|nr:hypothetical protein C0J52_00484 [Blattella germanica]